MAVASWKGSIRFGPLVQFPVKAVAVDRETKFAFNTHHDADGGRLRANPEGAVCEVCGDPVPKDHVVRGYKGVAGIDEEYVKALELERSSVLELDGLVPAEQVASRMYKRAYDVIAEDGGAPVYVLFMRALEKSGRVAVGKLTTGGKEQVVVVRPNGKTLEMDLLWWPEEIKASADAEASIAKVAEPDEKLMAMAMQLVGMMSRDFDADAYTNEYAAKLGAYLEAFVAGREPVKVARAAEPEMPAMSLEAALAQSLAALGGVEEPKKKGKAKAA